MSWQTVYFHYDEDALTIFANAGLLRRARKDVDNEKVSVTDANTGQFSSDGQKSFYMKQAFSKPVVIVPQQVVANIF